MYVTVYKHSLLNIQSLIHLIMNVCILLHTVTDSFNKFNKASINRLSQNRNELQIQY